MNTTQKEVLSDLIGKLRMLTIKRIGESDDYEEIAELEQKERILLFEMEAVKGDDIIAESIQDKALNYYSPFIKTLWKEGL